jgi:hypothetical protein
MVFKRRRTVHGVAEGAGDYDLLDSGLDSFAEDVKRSLFRNMVMT